MIACSVFTRQITRISGTSTCAFDIDLTGNFLHENPKFLRRALQTKINTASAALYEAVILGYGMCGGAATGLKAGRVPLVIPRVHDCISLFLGSHERYIREFHREPGTFWFIPEYLERRGGRGSLLRRFGGLGEVVESEMNCHESSRKMGPGNEAFVRSEMTAWKKRYRRGVLIEMTASADEELVRKVAEESSRNGWEFSRMKGSPRLLEKLLNGPWDEEFLVLAPGEEVPSFLPPRT